jgi:hypothetical protein
MVHDRIDHEASGKASTRRAVGCGEAMISLPPPSGSNGPRWKRRKVTLKAVSITVPRSQRPLKRSQSRMASICQVIVRVDHLGFDPDQRGLGGTV